MAKDPKHEAEMALLGFQSVVIGCLVVAIIIVAASKGLI